MFEPRPSIWVISLALLALPFGAMAASPASAAGAAEEAVRILSRAKSADARCNYLSAEQKAELSRYTARAEIAAVNQSSANAARKAAASGTAAGQAAACSPDLKADVQETLAAARDAIAAASAQEKLPPKAKKAAVVAMAGKPARRASRNLNGYARAVGAYYLERECRSLSRGEAGRFWRGIVKLHRQAVSSNGVGAVAPVMRNAERQARGTSCGSNVLAQIRSGYSETTGQ